MKTCPKCKPKPVFVPLAIVLDAVDFKATIPAIRFAPKIEHVRPLTVRTNQN